MRRVVRFALFVGVLALSGVTHASDVDDVKAAAEGWLSDANAQRAKSLVARYHPEETSYGGFGELLSEGVHTVDVMTAFYGQASRPTCSGDIWTRRSSRIRVYPLAT